jgi:hypothetical protein
VKTTIAQRIASVRDFVAIVCESTPRTGRTPSKTFIKISSSLIAAGLPADSFATPVV